MALMLWHLSDTPLTVSIFNGDLHQIRPNSKKYQKVATQDNDKVHKVCSMVNQCWFPSQVVDQLNLPWGSLRCMANSFLSALSASLSACAATSLRTMAAMAWESFGGWKIWKRKAQPWRAKLQRSPEHLPHSCFDLRLQGLGTGNCCESCKFGDWNDLKIFKGYCLFYCHAAWVVTARLQTTPPGNTKRLPIHSWANARQSMLSEHQVFCMCCLTGPIVILKHNHELHIGKIMKNKWVVNRHQLDSFHPIDSWMCFCQGYPTTRIFARHQLNHNITHHWSTIFQTRKRDDGILRNLQRQVSSPKPGGPSFSSFSGQGKTQHVSMLGHRWPKRSISRDSRPKLPKPKSSKIQNSAHLSTSASSHALIGLHISGSQTQNFHHGSLSLLDHRRNKQFLSMSDKESRSSKHTSRNNASQQSRFNPNTEILIGGQWLLVACHEHGVLVPCSCYVNTFKIFEHWSDHQLRKETSTWNKLEWS